MLTSQFMSKQMLIAAGFPNVAAVSAACSYLQAVLLNHAIGGGKF
jgi:hypothetical protein